MRRAHHPRLCALLNGERATVFCAMKEWARGADLSAAPVTPTLCPNGEREHTAFVTRDGERTTMRNILLAVTAGAAVLAVTSAQAQQTIKIGLILAYSGQFADPSAQMDNGIKLYMKQYGDTVAGKKIELIRRDTGGSPPDNAKPRAPQHPITPTHSHPPTSS